MNLSHVAIKLEIPRSRISDLLCSALEGGSSYWCSIDRKNKPKNLAFRSDEEHIYEHLDFPLNEGGSLTISVLKDSEGTLTIEDTESFTLNLESITNGLVIMATDCPRHFGDFMAETDDATTGDVFLQCCLFGEVIYG